ncbi:pyridoxamine 5'-phosphate oxidase family protein [Clostridium chromiireducens]|uniref:Pyridoxamine 5'-phosphate oxidase family protein n=1 Tax=Clostridium chromiireducens TaxID=225345 RepID=A0A399IKI6_9CLOT|nr:pyridoxamine 5'-phosphate oxidase family protein [Clostridium chromiireducens]RII33480.1 pyridoxamine 5'-phosphate oxidase family protein [Clostridium chromiireducens]
MTTYEKSLNVLEELFAKDYQFALATSNDNTPSVRFVDTFYDKSAFYIVSYAKSQKVKEIENNPKITMCNKLYRFTGIAHNIGHPLLEENLRIREKLTKAFEPWYFAHNNESDENMCYIKIELKQGFFYKDGTGYKIDFENREAEEFPFTFDIVMID